MLALALLATIAGAAPAPVAVAPWKNLNGDASLAWLEQGAAETMAADLKRAGVDVVERTQIAEALAQVRATLGGGDDVARAVAAGRIVGARSIVLGAFQRSGGQLRLTSRVVDVETGRVADAASATGALDDVFALQDKIVAALAPAPPKRAARPPRAPRKKGAQRVEAYAAFSRALDQPPAAQRALLAESLRLDPDLVYARDALAALEARLRAGAQASAVAWDARSKELLALVDDAGAPAERRRAAAHALLAELEGARRFRALERAAERVLAAELPKDVVDDPAERASYARVLALARLVRGDLALQAGERHLAQFPAGAHRAQVEALVRAIVDDRRSLDERRDEYAEELAEAAVAGGGEEGEDRDWRRCIAAKWSRLAREMVDECTTFLAKHPKSEHAPSGRAYVAWGHALAGDFAAAHAAAAALEREVPGALDDTGLRSVMGTWAAD